MPISKLVLIAIGVTGGVPASAAGVYIASLETIGSHFKHELLDLDDSYNEEWKLLQGRLDSLGTFPQLSSTGLGKAHKANDNGVKLKMWCKNVKKQTISTNESFRTSWQRDLIELVNWFCIITMVSKLENSLPLNDLHKGEFKKNLETFKDTQQNSDNSEFAIKLNKITSKFTTNQEEAVEDLIDWCGRVYTETYNKSKEGLLELVKKYCQKK